MDFNKQLRFGLRKSRVYGTLCSAILGAFIMAGPLVHADEVQPLNTTTEAVTTDTNKATPLATENTTVANTNTETTSVADTTTTNTTVTDTTVANTPTEISPYTSDKAIAAAKEAFDNIDTSKALTADDIKVPETLTSEQETVADTIKEHFDDLPAPVRSVTKKVIINDKDNGALGETYSIEGIVTVNAHYVHENSPRQAVETLYHEVGHAIDGATYKKTATGDYSLSRDEAVQPLLKTTYPGYANYEAFASLFGTYMLQETGQKEIKTATDAEIKKYFDTLLNGFTRPTENKYTKDLIATVNSLKANGKTVVYDGLVHVTTPEQAQKENQATIARLTNTRSRRSLSTLTRYTAAVPENEVTVTMTSNTTDKTIVVSPDENQTETDMNNARTHHLTINVSGNGQLDENDYILVETSINAPISNTSKELFKNDFLATNSVQTNNYQTTVQSRLSLKGLTAGTQKKFTIQTNSVNLDAPLPETVIKKTTYTLFKKNKPISTKTVTETIILQKPNLEKTDDFNRFILDKTTNTEKITTSPGRMYIDHFRSFGIVDIQVPKNVKVYESDENEFEEYKQIENDIAHYLLPQNLVIDANIKTNTSIDAKNALLQDPTQTQLTQNAKITYYYSNNPLSPDFNDIKKSEHIEKDFNIITSLKTIAQTTDNLKITTSFNDAKGYQITNKKNIVNTIDETQFKVSLLNINTDATATKNVVVPPIFINIDTKNTPLTDNLALSIQSDSPTKTTTNFDVYDADNNQHLATVQSQQLDNVYRQEENKINIPPTTKHLKIVPKTEVTIGTNAVYSYLNYKLHFSTNENNMQQWKNEMTTANQNNIDIPFTVSTDNETVNTKNLTILNDITAVKLEDNTYNFFAPNNISKDVMLSIKHNQSLNVTSSVIKKIEVDDSSHILSKDNNGNVLFEIKNVTLDKTHRPKNETFLDNDYTNTTDMYTVIDLGASLPSGTHFYNIPVKITTIDAVNTTDPTNAITTTHTTTATLHIATYDSETTNTASVFKTTNGLQNNVTLTTDENTANNLNLPTTIVTYVNNFTNNTIPQLEAMSYIPKNGIEGSTANATLTTAIKAPDNWKVQYTTDTISKNYNTDRQLHFEDTVSDYSKVTAIKFVSTKPIDKQTSTAFEIPLTVYGTPSENQLIYRSALLTTTEALPSAPITATAEKGNVQYQYVDKKTGHVLKTITHPEKFKDAIETYTFEPITINGYDYVRDNDNESNTVTTTLTNGTTLISRNYTAKNPTTVTIDYRFDETDENTKQFLQQNPTAAEEFKNHHSKNIVLNPGENTTISTDDTITYSTTKGNFPIEILFNKSQETNDKSDDITVANGTITGTNQPNSHLSITRTYKIATSKVTQRFVNEQGTALQPDIVSEPLIAGVDIIEYNQPYRLTINGKQYNVDKPTGGYLQYSDALAPTKSMVTNKTDDDVTYTAIAPNHDVILTYVCSEVTGSIYQVYLDENGNTLKDGVTIYDLPLGTIVPLSYDKVITSNNKVYLLQSIEPDEYTPIKNNSVEVTENGGYIEYKYKEIDSLTRYVTDKGVELQDAKEGTQPADKVLKDKWQYDHTEPKKDGITTHVYVEIQHSIPNDAPKLDKGELEATRYVTDKDVELQDAKEGTQPADKVLKDKWQYDHTEPKKDGVTTHVYVEIQHSIPNDAPKLDKGKLEVTRYMTDKGVELQDAKEGTQPADKVLKDKWQYDHTEPKKDNVTTHVYVAIQSAIPNDAPKLDKGELEATRYVTDKGVELQDAKEGTQPADKVLKDKWQYDHTEPKKDGVTTHVYVEVQHAIPNDAPKVNLEKLQLTRYITVNGDQLTPEEKGLHFAKHFDGYVYDHIEKTDDVITHIYRKVVETPKVPEQPNVPEQPKEQPTNVPTAPIYTDKTLPQTGDKAPANLLALGTLILGGLGLASTKRRKED